MRYLDRHYERVVAEYNERIAKAIYIVEATSFEEMTLWEERREEFDWQEDRAGYFANLGDWHKKPVCLSIKFARLMGLEIIFWEDTSMVVNHQMIDDWFKKIAPDVPRTNAMNFAHALHEIRRRILPVVIAA